MEPDIFRGWVFKCGTRMNEKREFLSMVEVILGQVFLVSLEAIRLRTQQMRGEKVTTVVWRRALNRDFQIPSVFPHLKKLSAED